MITIRGESVGLLATFNGEQWQGNSKNWVALLNDSFTFANVSGHGDKDASIVDKLRKQLPMLQVEFKPGIRKQISGLAE